MIRELSIKNFAIIPKLNLSFHEGMTTLTGETGAGKSIIIDAMSLLCGARSAKEFVRSGSEKAFIEGLFDMPLDKTFLKFAKENEIDLEEDALLIQRVIFDNGKSVARVNGRLFPISLLRKVGSFLVDIHGQNEHQELMLEENHLPILDSFSEVRVSELVQKYQRSFKEYQKILKIYRNRLKNEHEYAQRMDMLRFQVEELEEANLDILEEDRLVDERNVLVNIEKIAHALSYAYTMLNRDEESVLDKLGSAYNELEKIESIRPDFQKLSQTFSESYYLLQDVTSEIEDKLNDLEFDGHRLDEIENRLELIKTLKRKYGETIEDVLVYQEKVTQELAEMQHLEGSKEELSKALSDKKKEAITYGKELSKERKKVAIELQTDIQKELASLYMDKAQFQVKFTLNKEMTNLGLETVEFYITTNPGEPLKPLVKVASGGEMSRVMLALKTILSGRTKKTSIVFDEVDTGVSGRVAASIAEKIHEISVGSQVLCITHLPQVAASADYQYLIEKSVVDGRTQTSVKELSKNERIDEVARMLAGTDVTELSKEHAKELLGM